jgi:hypothetical protein
LVLAWVDASVFGSVVQTAEATSRVRTSDPATVEQAIEAGLAQVRSGQFPHMVAMFGLPDAQTVRDQASPIVMDEAGLSEQFERGLSALLDGAALRMGLGHSGEQSR